MAKESRTSGLRDEGTTEMVERAERLAVEALPVSRTAATLLRLAANELRAEALQKKIEALA